MVLVYTLPKLEGPAVKKRGKCVEEKIIENEDPLHKEMRLAWRKWERKREEEEGVETNPFDEVSVISEISEPQENDIGAGDVGEVEGNDGTPRFNCNPVKFNSLSLSLSQVLIS